MRTLLLSLLFLCNQAWGQLFDPTGSDWTQVMDGQDDAVVGIYLDHDFTLYGETFQNVWFSSNGFITFYDPTTDSTTQDAGGVYNPDPLNDAKWSYMLAPLWGDLRDIDSGNGSGFFFQTEETSSTFYWHNVTEDDSYATQNNNYTSTGDTNDFALVIYDDNSFDFLYDEINFVTQGFFMGLTGDATYYTEEEDDQGEYSYFREVASTGNFYPEYSNGTYNTTADTSWLVQNSGASYNLNSQRYEMNFDEQLTQKVATVDCSNPLNDVSCPGYNAAYFDQQCTADPLYDSQCNGYQTAYFNQQCGITATYSNDCPGYAAAYLYQQCELDAQYDESCDGYTEEDENYGDQLCDIDASQSASCDGYYDYDDQQDDNYYGDGSYGGGGYDGSDDGYDDYSMGDDGNNYTTDDDFYGDEGGYDDGYSDAYAGDYDDLGYSDPYNTDPYKDDNGGGYDDGPTYFDDSWNDDNFSEGPPDYDGPPPPMLLAGGPRIEDDFYSGALPPMPEIEAIFMPQGERRSPEEKREEVEEIDEIFEEFDDLEREFLEDDREEFFEEGEFRLIEDDMPPPMHHEEEFRPMAEPIMRDEPMVEEREIEPEAEVERVEEEPEERTTSVSSANVSIALQASDAAVRQAVEVGAGLSNAEVIAIDAGQVDTSVAVQQQDDGQQADTTVHFEMTHEETNHIVQDTIQENYIEEAQQTEETQEDFSFDTSSEAVIDEQFGEQMTQSFATGGSIGTFLSGQAPNFQQFDVRPPEYDVQRDIDQVESAVSSMSSQDISQQAERLAQQIQEGGGFEDDQTIAVTVLGYVPGFESYKQDVVDTEREFYKPETVYDGQRNIDDNRTMLFMTQQGDQRHTEMVADQYRR